ncbi:YehR family lipoprotein [Escherichia fergusonii]|uniref:YehR family lipoprotein n=1 Tax=Escherichia fergusonii TaxID=564 RepID=UPI0015EAC99E|nr:YehR family lipoprotein [Escherichia fergusonii]QMB00980.1 YehR family lipoprotein [Escherichia fergusonii]QMB09944.1 YehR family lipoprotein [Escherichia fergusonii]QMC63821.1 YehR family lipoprotein [Escherichia fergusonii]
MKAFNKLFSMVVASVLVFSLAGCGDKEETKKFTANLNGSEIAVTYTYKGDKVLKQTSENKIMYSSINAANKEDAAKILDPISAKYKNLVGVEEKLTYKDSWAEETVSVDMEKVDLKELQKAAGTMISGDTSKGISMKQSQKVLEAAGFKEVK